VELKIATTCEDCHGTGVQGHERCPRCDGGSIWVVVLKRGANPHAGPE
jgi:DnaJ-class molecular chaperone